jgi:catechol 2,3-dioxygenase-like lactoylglutathione lyase family enzyme
MICPFLQKNKMNRHIFFITVYTLIMLSCNHDKKKNTTMNQRMSIITIGTDNLQAMRQFYVEKFGWQPVAENKDIIFFKLNGFLLGLFGRKEMATFNNTSPEGSGFRPYNLAYMVNTKEEVEQIYADLKAKGVTIVQEPKVPPVLGGYYFLFKDVEGNIWEVAYNPYIPIGEDGNVITHKSIDHL